MRLLRHMQPRSIQGKIVLWTGLCLLLAAIPSVAYATRVLHSTATTLAQERAVATASRNATHINAEFEQAFSVVRALAQSLAAVKDAEDSLDLNREQVSSMLRQALVSNPQFVGVYLRWEPPMVNDDEGQFATPDGANQPERFSIYWHRNEEGDIQRAPLAEAEAFAVSYECARQTRNECVSEPAIYPRHRAAGMITSLVVPIMLDGQFYGIAGIDLQLAFLQTLADGVDIYDGTGTLALISNQGTLAAVTRQSTLIGQDARALHTDFDSDDERTHVERGDALIEYQAVEDEVELFVPIDIGRSETPWSVSVTIPAAKIDAEVVATVWPLVGIATVMTGIGLVLLWLVAGQIVRPIKRMTSVVREVAQGNLRVQATVTSRDETGLLATIFNQMMKNLHEAMMLERETREALRLSEERYREFVEGTDDLITQVDKDGRFTFVNHTAERVFGMPVAACLGRSAFTVVHPDDREYTQQSFARWLQQGDRSVTLENRQISCTGDVYHMLWTINLHYDQDGIVTSINSIARDITNLRRTEEALRENQSLLQGLLDNAPAAIYVKDMQERFLLVNREFASWLRADVWQIIGQAAEACVPAMLATKWVAQDHQVMQGISVQIEETTFGEDGFPRTYLTTKFPLYDGRRKAYAIGGISSDITERKHIEAVLEQRVREQTAALIETNRTLLNEIAERQRVEASLHATNRQLESVSTQLQRNRDVLQTIFDSMSEGLLLLDHTGTVLAANRSIMTLLGCHADELIRHPWEQFCRLDGTVEGTPQYGFPGRWVLDAFQDGRPRYQRERFAYNGGDPQVLDMQALPILAIGEASSSPQRVDQVVLHVVDVTEQIQLEALMLENERFAASRQLAQVVAHEVNSPLQAIMFSLDALLRKTNQPEQRTFLTVAQEEIERVGAILHQLKDMYQPPSDGPVVVDANALLERGLLLTAGKLAQQHIRVERDMLAGLPAVFIRADQLMQVFLNILLNAVDVMPDGGTLRIFTGVRKQESDSTVMIKIGDTGAGIDPDVQAQIFDPFFTTKEHGTGLGLSVSQKILRDAHGTIAVHSTPGVGTTFTIHLPITRESNV